MTPKEKKIKLIKISLIGVIIYYFLSKSTTTRSAIISTNQTATQLKKLILGDPEIRAALKGVNVLSTTTTTQPISAESIVSNFHFNKDLKYDLNRNYAAIYVNKDTGVDGLNPESYYTTSKFKTLEAAIEWANENQRNFIRILIENTTVLDPLKLTRRAWVNDKKEIYISGAGNFAQFLDLNGFDISFNESNATISNLQVNIRTNYGFRANSNSNLKFAKVTLIPDITVNFLIFSSECTIVIEAGMVVQFSNNNQTLFTPSGGGHFEVIKTSNLSPPCEFNLNGFTGVKFSTPFRLTTLRQPTNASFVWTLDMSMVHVVGKEYSNAPVLVEKLINTDTGTFLPSDTLIMGNATNCTNSLCTIQIPDNCEIGKVYTIVNIGSSGNLSAIFANQPLNYLGFTNEFKVSTRNNTTVQPADNTNLFNSYFRFVKTTIGFLILGNPAF